MKIKKIIMPVMICLLIILRFLAPVTAFAADDVQLGYYYQNFQPYKDGLTKSGYLINNTPSNVDWKMDFEDKYKIVSDQNLIDYIEHGYFGGSKSETVKSDFVEFKKSSGVNEFDIYSVFGMYYDSYTSNAIKYKQTEIYMVIVPRGTRICTVIDDSGGDGTWKVGRLNFYVNSDYAFYVKIKNSDPSCPDNYGCYLNGKCNGNYIHPLYSRFAHTGKNR